MAEACEALQITRYQLKQLLDAGVIPVIQKPSSLNRDWVIDKAQCRALIEDLRKKARKTRPPPGAVSMAGIQRQGYSIVQLVEAMQTGELEYGLGSNSKQPESFKQFKDFKINKIS
jgi:hypothetical protein